MYVKTMTLRNIKAFKKLHLDFSRPRNGSYGGVNVFVGGNASGKSTLLKCIAIGAAGPIASGQLVGTSAGWIRHGSKSGSIEIALMRDTAFDRYEGEGPPSDELPIRIPIESIGYGSSSSSASLEADSMLFPRRGPWNPSAQGWFIAAYGPFRRLTGSSTDALNYAKDRGKVASCLTLFREDAALTESETWLKLQHARNLEQKNGNQPASSLVDDVTRFLNDGLLPAGFQITTVSVDEVRISTPNGGDLPMRDLSDGCRSAFALVLDIVHHMCRAKRGEDLFSINEEGRTIVTWSGVVLIDEIEAHLHPSWQRVVCEWLKTRFPQVQFFITTHSPLIVQAADPGGIFVLPLPDEIADGSRVRKLDQDEEQRVVLGGADAVLLGRAFRLNQTWSVRTADKVSEWENLVARRHAEGVLPDSDQKQYEDLSKQMETVFNYPVGATD